jgi:hypothetical protein
MAKPYLLSLILYVYLMGPKGSSMHMAKLYFEKASARDSDLSVCLGALQTNKQRAQV